MSTRTSYLAADNPVDDLVIAETEAAELEDYIIDDELYRTTTARTSEGDQSLKMTGGDLLARLHRLQAIRSELTPEQQQRLDVVQKAVDATIYSLRTRFHDRLKREVKARLDSLKWFLDDVAQDARRARTEYPFEIRNRQRIEEIKKELGADLTPDLANAISQLDQRLRMLTAAGNFVWDARLKSAYPANPYWYLYVTP